jgi:hypothetical protein
MASATDRGAHLHACHARQYPRSDVVDIVALLLERGVDPNQRGINDYTALHMAVAEGTPSPCNSCWTPAPIPISHRIDDCETPLEMAQTIGSAVSAGFSRGGKAAQSADALGLSVARRFPAPETSFDVRAQLRCAPPDVGEREKRIRWDDSVGPSRRVPSRRRRTATRHTSRGPSTFLDSMGCFYGVEGMRVGGHAPARDCASPRIWRA